MKQLLAGLLGGVASMVAMASTPTAWAPAAWAQSHPVVQAIPGENNRKLSAALARLGRDSRDIAALIDAGDAARALEDYDAAIGFYRRAEEVSPSNARVKAGLGSAFVLKGDPLGALPHFDAAERAGGTPALMAADRGLAYDLLGDNASAQKHYAQALSAVPSAQADDVRSRLAVSQAIAGNAEAAYATLLPLLNKQDKPGWRTRAFTLAIAGDTNEAVDVAGKILPAPLAQNIAPYLRYMPRLTRAQQAAAANLGRFPKASEIGRDDPRIAAYTPPATVGAGSALVPKGAPLGRPLAASTLAVRKEEKPRRSRAPRSEAPTGWRQRAGANAARPAQVAVADPARVAPPEPKPAIERSSSGELPPLARSASLPASTGAAAVPAPAPSASAPAAAKTQPATAALWGAAVSVPATSPAIAVGSTPTTGPRLTLPPVAQSSVATEPPASRPVAPAPAAAPQSTAASVASTAGAVPPAAAVSAPITPPPVPGPNQLSLSEIFADLGKPTADALPVSGAVDMRLITPAAPPQPRIQLPKPEETRPVEAKAADPEPEAKAKSAAEPKTRAAKAAEAKAKAKAEAEAAKKKKPAPPAHPSRTWVQIGVGRDKSAIAFDWRRNAKEHAALFKSREPYISEMGRTNRVLVGPFASRAAANAFIADARKQGFTNVLPWVSAEGEAVEPLSAK